MSIDDYAYLRFSAWPPFVPDMLRVDDAPPLIRVTDTGDVYVRFYDRDILLFNFSGNRFRRHTNLSEEMDQSVYFAEHPDARIPFENYEMDIRLGVKGQILRTPNGMYQNCMGMGISCENPVTGENTTTYQYFDRDAGLVFKRIGRNHTGTLLVGDSISGEPFGLTPVSPDTAITGDDIAEMLRTTMEWHMSYISIMEIGNYAIDPPELFLASDGLEDVVPYLPATICGIPLTVMTRQELQAWADEWGNMQIIGLRGDIVAEDDVVSFELHDYMMIQMESSRGNLYGHGYGMEFNRRCGYWLGKILHYSTIN